MEIIAAWFAIGIIASILEVEILAMGIMICLVIADVRVTQNEISLIIISLLSIGMIKNFIRQASY